MRLIEAPETFVDLVFPLGGIDRSRAYSDPRPQSFPDGAPAFVTRSGLNVRAFDALLQRARGGSRPGLVRYVTDPLVRGWIVQGMNSLLTTGETDLPQQSQSGRVVILVAVSQGQVYTASPGDEAWTLAELDAGVENPPLNFTGLVRSTVANQKMWFADGVHYVYYDPDTGKVHNWTETTDDGVLPEDEDGNTPRLIATWRGRIILSGILNEPQNWYMSATGNPHDFDYFPDDITPTQAVAGNNSPLGLVGDVITALIPLNDDVLIVGGDHTIWAIAGDPMAGGQIDRISDTIGIAWGEAWARGPDGTLYFFSNLCGIYAMERGGMPVRISQPIEQFLQETDTGFYGVRMFWNDRHQGLHVFVTFLSFPAPAIHFFWESRTNAWWVDTFADENHNPLCGCLFDGNRPQDRLVLVGAWDGFVRAISPEATTDDGKAIQSSVVIGPLVTKDLDEILVKDLQAVLGETSGEVEYAVYSGATAEIALSNDPVAEGVWGPGRNPLSFVRYSGHALYVRLASTEPWAMEQIRARIAGAGKVRRRGL